MRVFIMFTVFLCVTGIKSKSVDINYYPEDYDDSNSEERKYIICDDTATDCPPRTYCLKRFTNSKNNYCADCRSCSDFFRRNPKENIDCAINETDCGECLDGWYGRHCNQRGKLVYPIIKSSTPEYFTSSDGQDNLPTISTPKYAGGFWISIIAPALSAAVILFVLWVVYCVYKKFCPRFRKEKRLVLTAFAKLSS